MNRKRIIITSTIAAVGVIGVLGYSFINSSSNSASSEPNHDDAVDAAAVSVSATDAFLAPVETLAAETSEPVEAPADFAASTASVSGPAANCPYYNSDDSQYSGNYAPGAHHEEHTGYAEGQSQGYYSQGYGYGHQTGHHGQGSHRGQGVRQGRHYENCPYYSATE